MSITTNESLLRDNFARAKEIYESTLAKENENKTNLKKQKFDSLSQSDQNLYQEYLTTRIGGFGIGMKIFLFIVFAALALIAYKKFLVINLSEVYVYIIGVVLCIILSNLIVFMMNSKSRKRAKRKRSIVSNVNIQNYIKYCSDLDEQNSDELIKAYEDMKECEYKLFDFVYMDTVLIFAPSQRVEDGVTVFKSVSVYIDGMPYCENLRKGLTPIQLQPGYHTIRFEEYSKPRNSDGYIAAFRQGAYGSSATVAEYTCQVDMSSRKPVGIILEDKKSYRTIKEFNSDDYDKYINQVT